MRIYGHSPYRSDARNIGARYACLADGGSGTYLYVREPSPGVFVFLEVIDMVDACGRDATERWAAQVDVVDTGNVNPDTVASAIRSCGWFEDHEPEEVTPIMLAECLHSYGAKAPVWEGSAGPVNERNRWDTPDDTCRHFRTLRANARRAADAVCDESAREYLLDNRIVNAIGQTAREFANGTQGLWDALRRIAADPNASASQKLVLRVYQHAGQTLGAGPVPADIVAAEE